MLSMKLRAPYAHCSLARANAANSVGKLHRRPEEDLRRGERHVPLLAANTCPRQLWQVPAGQVTRAAVGQDLPTPCHYEPQSYRQCKPPSCEGERSRRVPSFTSLKTRASPVIQFRVTARHRELMNEPENQATTTPADHQPPIRVGVAFAAFPVRDITPYKYFVLLLNRLQHSCEYELVDIYRKDHYVKWLRQKLVPANPARDSLAKFGARIHEQIAAAIDVHGLAVEQPDQLVIVTGATLSDYHYLIRRDKTTLLALGQWERFMAPPSLAEFLQLLLLRAPFSALEGAVWENIHLGNRACVFDFTDNLENTRFMALAGVGVCESCEAALKEDGYPAAPEEIRRVAAREWRGELGTAGTPANIMARLGYNLFLTKGFEPGVVDRLRKIFTDDTVKELIKFSFAALLAWLVFTKGWKK